MRRVVLLMVALLASCGWALGQQRTVKGVVTSAEDGSTLPSVTVQIKGTLTGVATDLDGRYSITVPGPETILKFAYAGMETQEIQVGNQSTINVALKVKLEEIDQAVVIGYGTRGKNQITGSTQQVGSEELTAVATVSPEQALQGKVPGLVVSSTSGTPGSTQDILIRGQGSMTAGTSPLYVIDGVPVVSGFGRISGEYSTLSLMSTINQEDIASITMLKDASATAAYGARGSNGVIVITTKQGQKGVTKFNFSGYFGSQSFATQPLPMMNAQERFETFARALRNNIYIGAIAGSPIAGEYFSGSGVLSPESKDFALQIWEAVPSEEKVQEILLGSRFKDWDEAGRPSSDFLKEFSDPLAPMFNGVLSARGGGEGYRFYASVGFNRTNNIMKSSNFRRVSGKLNFDKDMTRWLKFTSNNTVSYTKQKNPLLEQAAYFANPYTTVFLAPPDSPIYDENGYPEPKIGGLFYNYLLLKDYDIKWQANLRGTTNNSLEATIIPGLKYKTQLSMDWMLFDGKQFGSREAGQYVEAEGSSYRALTQTFNYVWQNSLSYSFTFLEDHQLDLMALIEYQKNKRHFLDAEAKGTVSDGLNNIASMSKEFDASSSFYDWMNAAYLLMANYSYLGRYIIDVTYRREGNSRFPKEGRFGNFGSVGLAWNIHEEPFFKDAREYVDRLRLRASWGVSGNSSIRLNTYQSMLNFSGAYNTAVAADLSGYGNPELTWEKNSTFDIGIDFGVLNSRIEGSFSFFNKITSDLLQAVPLSRTTGFSSVMQNIGSISNRGIELLLNFHILGEKMYHLDLNFNMGTVRNRVIKLAKDGTGKVISPEGSWIKTDVGHMLEEWHLPKWAGVSEDTGLPLWYTDKSEKEVTTNYADADKVYMGKSTMPKYTAGLGLHADAWGAYVDVSFAYMGGHLIQQTWGDFIDSETGRGVVAVNMLKSRYNESWYKPGVPAKYPMITFGEAGAFGANEASSRYLFKGDFIRMKDLTVGYNFPQSLLNRMKYQGTISIYLRATNLWTIKFDKDLDFDPETGLYGAWNVFNPPLKVLSVGLNMNF